jgi:hypothetical protein
MLNDPSDKFNVYISEALEAINQLLIDPLVTFRPSQFGNIRGYKDSIGKLRGYLRQRVQARLKEMEIDESAVPKDILTYIINASSKIIKKPFLKL